VPNKAHEASCATNEPMAVSAVFAAMLVATAAACPDASWTAANGSCYRVTREYVPHWECDSLCGPNASLACVGSATENAVAADLVARLWPRFAWIGLYQRPGSAEPRGGWDTCSTGEANAFANWAPGYPDNSRAADQACAEIDVSTWGGQWLDWHCSVAQPCLCEHGASSSSEYHAFATDERDGLTAWTLVAFLGLIPPLWLLPIVLVRCCSHIRQCFRPLTPPNAASGAESSRRSSSDSVDRSAAKLAESERAHQSLRLRVSGTIAWVGWALLVLGFAPYFIWIFVGLDFASTAGCSSYYFCAAYWGVAVLPLALRPTDAARITFACRFFFGLGIAFALLEAWVTSLQPDPISQAIFLALTVLCCAFVALLAPTVLALRGGRCQRPTMPPRRQLLRLWLLLRFVLLGIVCIFSSALVAVGLRDGWAILLYDPEFNGLLVSKALTLPVPLLFTPTFRGRVHRWLGSLGKSDSQQQQAAAVASLIGGRDLAGALRTARDTFRVLPLAGLTVSDLAPGADLAAANSLSSRTCSAVLGECDAFMSHSWRDDGEKKFQRLHEHNWGTMQPTIWLDKVHVPYRHHAPCRARSDVWEHASQACIDQTNIDASLAVLPIFLSGCKTLLILPGKTYATRLWW
jgi:hypothetical protein